MATERLNLAGGGATVAVVHDFLYTHAGAERVLEQILHAYPDADVFALFDFLPEGQRRCVHGKPVTTTFLQRMPFARSRHRAYLPLMPLAIEQLDVGRYDLVLSSSYVAAKGVLTRPDQFHACYCHSPARFAWDLQNQYLAQSGLGAAKSLLSRLLLHYFRMWDVRSSHGVDLFIANSDYVGRRIEKAYRRRSQTVHPPVDLERFVFAPDGGGDNYVTTSRLVPYKRVDLLVEAFARMPDRRLTVVGEGPLLPRLRASAPDNVRFAGAVAHDQLVRYLQGARAFVYAAEEDFGIAMVEAQACGTPVIAFARGGAGEIVLPGVSGLLFDPQTPEALVHAVRRFERAPAPDRRACRANAERFSIERFRRQLRETIEEAHAEFRRRLNPPPDPSDLPSVDLVAARP